MIDLRADFRERVAEVEAFLELVIAVEHSVRNGAPILGNSIGGATVVKPLQQKLLNAGVYLHLYNLVEATVSRCIAAIEAAASAASQWEAGDLSVELRKEWVRTMAKTHELLSYEHRWEAALSLCNHLVERLPVRIEISQGGGGNWDDEEIFRFAKRLGIQLKLKTVSAVKRPFRDDKGALQLIRHLRNKLAHGEMSFAECGDGLTADQLIDLKERTLKYLEEVIDNVEGFIQRHEYLAPSKRPVSGAG